MKKGVYLLPFLIIVLFLILLNTSFYFREGFYDSNTSKIITTIAGTGTAGYSGDGGPATRAEIKSARAVNIDSSRNIYIVDTGNHRIRKINIQGIITTIAGTGTAGYSGDGGSATNATLDTPSDLTFDSLGNIYIADLNNNRIRKINTQGIITTIAGGGNALGDGGLATSAQINKPNLITLDSLGNIYIVDSINDIIRKVNAQGIITTIAGGGNSLGDGGPATSAKFGKVSGIKIDSAGNIYISDNKNHTIRKIYTQGIITTIAGTGTAGYSGDGGPATDAQMNGPRRLNIDSSGNIYIADKENKRIRQIDTQGIITTIAGTGTEGYSGNGGPPTNANINNPWGISFDSSENIYIVDNNIILKINSTFDKEIMSKTYEVPSEYYKGVTKHYPKNRILGTWKFWKQSTDFIF